MDVRWRGIVDEGEADGLRELGQRPELDGCERVRGECDVCGAAFEVQRGKVGVWRVGGHSIRSQDHELKCTTERHRDLLHEKIELVAQRLGHDRRKDSRCVWGKRNARVGVVDKQLVARAVWIDGRFDRRADVLLGAGRTLLAKHKRTDIAATCGRTHAVQRVVVDETVGTRRAAHGQVAVQAGLACRRAAVGVGGCEEAAAGTSGRELSLDGVVAWVNGSNPVVPACKTLRNSPRKRSERSGNRRDKLKGNTGCSLPDQKNLHGRDRVAGPGPCPRERLARVERTWRRAVGEPDVR